MAADMIDFLQCHIDSMLYGNYFSDIYEGVVHSILFEGGGLGSIL
jgi:hypothetical protein